MSDNKNVFIANIRGIIMEAYDGHETPVNDWNVAIDKYSKRTGITKNMAPTDIAIQRHEFMQYVKGKAFNKYGDERA